MGSSLKPFLYEITDINKALFLPDNVKVSITIDGIRFKTNLKFNLTLVFTEKSFLYSFMFYSTTVLSSKRYRWILPNDCGNV